jgi:hypothetical protein
MKTILAFVLLSFSMTSMASIEESKFICSLLNLKRVKAIATTHSTYDKNRHCSVSCMLTVKCPAVEVMSVGVLKEIQDMFGEGTPDINDIKADAFGINLVLSQAARTDSQCLSQCDLYYHE